MIWIYCGFDIVCGDVECVLGDLMCDFVLGSVFFFYDVGSVLIFVGCFVVLEIFFEFLVVFDY